MGNSDSRCKPCRNCTGSHSNVGDKCTCSCKKRVTCTCKCNVGKGHDIAQKVSAVVGGTAVGTAGILVTVLTGGVALPIVGGMLAATGISSLIHGLVKAVKREKICGKRFGADVGVGFVTGVMGGGSAVATECLASVAVSNIGKDIIKRGAINFGIRAAGGIVSSVTRTAVCEIGDCAKGNKNWRDYGNDPMIWVKAILFGATAGTDCHTSTISKLRLPAQIAATQINKEKEENKKTNQLQQHLTLPDISSNFRSSEKSQEFIMGLPKTTLTPSKEIWDKVKEDNENPYEMVTFAVIIEDPENEGVRVSYI
ncbi:uncharacterized protein LOC135216826 [Macrobrachium nipponense]|uniref:uncharacterized protein LOC135216826 n=1 Tax=Macrobrachium nipponense TaxID=159736 RepID=UPI0030C88F3B